MIEKCTFEEIYESKRLIAKRPLNITLDITKISKEMEMPYLSKVINSFYDEYFSNYKDQD